MLVDLTRSELMLLAASLEAHQIDDWLTAKIIYNMDIDYCESIHGPLAAKLWKLLEEDG